MKPYHNIPIIECGEPLVAIPTTFAFFKPHPYQALGAPYASKSPFYLRIGVLQSLQVSLQYLQEIYPQWQIKIFDAYRPIAVQKFMVEHTLEQLALSRGWQKADLSPAQYTELMAEVLQFWAMPSTDPATPPPHSTGAAIDVTLVNQDNIEIDMGSEIDEISPRSFPDYYQPDPNAKANQFHEYRQLLNQVMSFSGFQRHPYEWWHFSLGDQMWAWLLAQQHDSSQLEPAIARYGHLD